MNYNKFTVFLLQIHTRIHNHTWKQQKKTQFAKKHNYSNNTNQIFWFRLFIAFPNQKMQFVNMQYINHTIEILLDKAKEDFL